MTYKEQLANMSAAELAAERRLYEGITATCTIRDPDAHARLRCVYSEGERRVQAKIIADERAGRKTR